MSAARPGSSAPAEAANNVPVRRGRLRGGDWEGGFFGSFVGALLAIPAVGALQVITRELWQATASRDRHPKPT